MLKQDGTPDQRFKENKGGGFLNVIMSLAYILVIGVFLYVGWLGFIRLFIGKNSNKNDELAMKLAGIHGLTLIGMLIAGFLTEGSIQDWFIKTTVFGAAWSIIFTIVGSIIYGLLPNNK